MKTRIGMLGLLLLALTACVVSGTKFTTEQVRKIQNGMTKDQVLAIMPQPQFQKNMPDGTERWGWAYKDYSKTHYAWISFQSNVVIGIPGKELSPAELKALKQESELDQLMGREPKSVRQHYVDTHPDLNAHDREWILRGWISTSDFERKQQEEKDRNEAIEQIEREGKQAREKAEQARKDYAEKRTDVPQVVRNAILERRIVIGMTPDQVKLSYGEPDRVTTTETSFNRYESWSYGDDTILQFSNGILKSWTQSR